MSILDLVQLRPLMAKTEGRPEFVVALIDGPVAMDHPDFAKDRIRAVPGKQAAACSWSSSVACMHGTFVAGVLVARRGGEAAAICPGCTLLVRPIFAEQAKGASPMPAASPEELARAITDCVDAGVGVINLSSALLHPSSKGARQVEAGLDYAAQRNVLVVAAAGNQSAVGSSAVTRHPWVIPVVACDERGRPTAESNLGGSIGRSGYMAPGENVSSLGTDGKVQTFSGTSAAAPFVTGAIALLWSEFPGASAGRIKLALTHAAKPQRRTIVPPLLDAWAAYQVMSSGRG
jgi:subtilisin family serine protease